LLTASTRSATRASRVENTLRTVAMPDSKKTGVSATWMITVSRADPELSTPNIGDTSRNPLAEIQEIEG
jgi:hypothetical protein